MRLHFRNQKRVPFNLGRLRLALSPNRSGDVFGSEVTLRVVAYQKAKARVEGHFRHLKSPSPHSL